MTNENMSGLAEINILDITKAEFYVSESSFTGLRYDGREYSRIILSRILPLNDPDRYISVIDTNGNEVGILRSIEELSGQQAEIVKNELSKRYHCPVISRIASAKEKTGYVYFDVDIKGKSKTFAVKDVSRNIRQLDDGRIIVFDVDGNRYLIENMDALDPKSARYIEPYLF